jgi:hypothetical protein
MEFLLTGVLKELTKISPPEDLNKSCTLITVENQRMTLSNITS